MTYSITTNRVSCLEIIPDSCSQRYPCDHVVKVTLEGGKSRTVNLASYEIDILIQSIAKEKIVSSCKNSHFKVFDDGERELEFFTGKKAFPTSDEILTQIFNDKN